MLVSNFARSLLPLPGKSFVYSARSAAVGGRTVSLLGGATAGLSSGAGFSGVGGVAVLSVGVAAVPLVVGGGVLSLFLCSQPAISASKAKAWVVRISRGTLPRGRRSF